MKTLCGGWFLVAGLAVAMAGCDVPVRSVDPLYTEFDVVFEPKLLGTWTAPGTPDGSLVVMQKDANAYLLMTTDGVAFDGRLSRLGAHLFFDLVPLTKSEDDFRIPAHLILQVELSGDTLRLLMLEAGRSKDLAHSAASADVITASTRELQEFVTLHADEGSVFVKIGEFQRQGIPR